MAIIAYVGSPNLPHVPGGMVPKTSQAFTTNQLVDRDTTNSVVKPSTSSSTIETLFAVMTDKTVTTAASNPANLDGILITGDSSQMWIVDCTNSTAANQLYKPQVLTDAGTINNSSSATLSNTGVFIPVQIAGASTDKKLIGYFVVTNQAS